MERGEAHRHNIQTECRKPRRRARLKTGGEQRRRALDFRSEIRDGPLGGDPNVVVEKLRREVGAVGPHQGVKLRVNRKAAEHNRIE